MSIDALHWFTHRFTHAYFLPLLSDLHFKLQEAIQSDISGSVSSSIDIRLLPPIQNNIKTCENDKIDSIPDIPTPFDKSILNEFNKI
jgi:hypothetical protein